MDNCDIAAKRIREWIALAKEQSDQSEQTQHGNNERLHGAIVTIMDFCPELGKALQQEAAEL